MQDAFRIQCDSCLHPGNRLLYAEIYRVLRQHGFATEDIVTPQSSDETCLKETISMRGLCISCSRKKTCRGAATEGGVWHCKEYE